MKAWFACVRLASAFIVLWAWCQPAFALSEQARDWWVTCDDARDCSAEIIGKSEDDRRIRISLERDARPGSLIAVILEPQARLRAGTDVSLEIAEPGHSVSATVEQGGSGNQISFVAAPNGALIMGLRRGRQATVSIRQADAGAATVYRFSLSGVTTALMVMDLVQQRIDRLDAAVADGGEPVDSPSAMPQFLKSRDLIGEFNVATISSVPGLPTVLVEHVTMMMNCELYSAMKTLPATVHRLSGEFRLFQVPCRDNGVNREFAFAATEARNFETAVFFNFRPPPDQDSPPSKTLFNPVWNSETGLLTAWNKTRAEGDCGRFQVFAWTGKRFDLIEVREKPVCDGVQSSPEDYPLVYSSL